MDVPEGAQRHKQKIVVVGAGIAGMATAIRLAAAGHQVRLCETNTQLGGKLTDTRLGEYRFDNGPSLFTMPELLEELFSLAGKKLSDFLQYERLDLVTRYFYPDGVIFNAWSDPERFAAEATQKTGIPKSRLLRYFQRAGFIYATTTPVFLERSLHQWSNYLRTVAIRGILRLPWLGTHLSMHRFNTLWLKEPHMVQLFDRFATYNGSDPYRAPATLAQIAHIEHAMGAWYPKGGMIAIRNALQQLLEALDVEILYNHRVDEVLTNEGKVTGVRVGEKRIEANKVVFGGDVHQLYERLLHRKLQLKMKEQDLSTSAIIFHWAVASQHPQLDLHNIFFSHDYKNEFEQLAQGKLSDDPTIYLYLSARKNQNDAPEGCENWFVMINTPPNNGQDWQSELAKSRAQILQRLETELQVAIEAHIVAESVITPVELENRTGSKGGAIYGNASNTRWAAFLRHANYSSRIKGLYFVGGSVHPGGGIPLCLYSARIVDELIHGQQ